MVTFRMWRCFSVEIQPYCSAFCLLCVVPQLGCRDYLAGRGIILLVCNQSGQRHNTINTKIPLKYKTDTVQIQKGAKGEKRPIKRHVLNSTVDNQIIINQTRIALRLCKIHQTEKERDILKNKVVSSEILGHIITKVKFPSNSVQVTICITYT